ncbi:hypothetical protein PoB_001239700 [Plakobranchus ocellatus]|uniref:Uncharacterized protein n=1 Tax=Plakobranchus ocellatus TaxID=259542 RepID=A0AAV3YSH7_9GAST|nr:hypothetical protein PoB_001239700 [Plakobranchus ocellatus]
MCDDSAHGDRLKKNMCQRPIGSDLSRIVGYHVRNPGFESQSGPNNVINAPPCPLSTKWLAAAISSGVTFQSPFCNGTAFLSALIRYGSSTVPDTVRVLNRITWLLHTNPDLQHKIFLCVIGVALLRRYCMQRTLVNSKKDILVV